MSLNYLKASVLSLNKSDSKGLSLTLAKPHSWKFLLGKLDQESSREPLILEGPGSKMEFKVEEDFHLKTHLNTQLSGMVDLAFLSGAFDPIETLSGVVTIDAFSKGPLQDLVYKLRVGHSENSSDPKVIIGIKDFKPALDDVQFKLSVDRSSAKLEYFRASKGRGKVAASGVLELKEGSDRSSRLQISLDQAAVSYPLPLLRFIDTNLSGDLVISGKKRPYQVTGDILINRGRATRNFDVREEIINSLRRQETSSLKVGGLNESFFEFDVGIRADSSLLIKNQNVSAILSADLKFTGPDKDPIILGETTIDEGKFIYKRDFKISQGVLTFDEISRSDPAIDVLGVSEINGYRVYVALTGRASRPSVDLSIDPPTRPDGRVLSKIDIIVLLSTGGLPETRNDRLSFQGVATSEALNIIAGQFEQPLEKIMNLSGQTLVREVYIDTYSDPSKDGRPTARLNFPINVHQDWDVLFRVDGNENWRVSLGYDLNSAINVSGNYDRQKESNTPGAEDVEKIDTGVDMRFQFNFP